ncbi:MAG: 50S ribosomal protein L34 [Candidatus Pacebacteria bacterium]|jgi:large subunit ribosomal protein L34|nr:50S ribosomal protein L34 [Candidatus Paceibacterota bacterium]MDD5012862.1 50S ribosomal protein L34 [Candidatus Paceibacterota bacterium]MDD5752793.1 50S ribosomal protein L34 [Candidatus Paceibacterota bacterium]
MQQATTYKPKKKKRKRTHGFMKRTETPSGKKVLKKRRNKGRAKLTV